MDQDLTKTFLGAEQSHPSHFEVNTPQKPWFSRGFTGCFFSSGWILCQKLLVKISHQIHGETNVEAMYCTGDLPKKTGWFFFVYGRKAQEYPGIVPSQLTYIIYIYIYTYIGIYICKYIYILYIYRLK